MLVAPDNETAILVNWNDEDGQWVSADDCGFFYDDSFLGFLPCPDLPPKAGGGR